MPTFGNYKTPCKTCNGYNPLLCETCKKYKQKIIKNSNGVMDALKVTRIVEEYWKYVELRGKEKIKEHIKDTELFTEEDYDKLD